MSSSSDQIQVPGVTNTFTCWILAPAQPNPILGLFLMDIILFSSHLQLGYELFPHDSQPRRMNTHIHSEGLGYVLDQDREWGLEGVAIMSELCLRPDSTVSSPAPSQDPLWSNRLL